MMYDKRIIALSLMQQINISVPDQVDQLLKVMAKESGQSNSSLASSLLSQSIYEEASRRFKGINYLKTVGEYKKEKTETQE